MDLSDKQAFIIIWLMMALIALCTILVLFSSVTFGPGIGMLSLLIFVLVSVFIFIVALMYIKGAIKFGRPVTVPLKKSEVKTLLLSQKSRPFQIKKGRKSNISLVWNLERFGTKKEYVMDVWLDEKTHSCNFSEEVRDKGKVVKIGPKYGVVEMLRKKEKSLLTPSIWPLLTGGRDFDPYEARKLIWDVCESSGWKMVRL